jgi:hypothetical protein
MVTVMDSGVMNNLLGRGSYDPTPASFRPHETLHARVTQGIVIGAIGDLLILNAVNNLASESREMFAVEQKRLEREEYEAGKRILAEAGERAQERWLASQRLHGSPPPLERQPGESEAVFELKQLARQEFLSGQFGDRQ